MLTNEELQRQIRALGICQTDTVLIHTSMRAIGPCENGANGVIDAFCRVLTEGLFLVPTHTWASVCAENPIYDVRTSIPCIGALPCAAAGRSDGFRSLHPTHSIWGYGRGAEDFLRGEELAPSPGAPGFAWARLAESDAKILLLGVKNDKNTFIHAVEEIADIPDRLGKPYEVVIRDRTGKESRHAFRPHSCSRSPDVSRHFVNFDEALTVTGAQHFGRLGEAEVRIVSARRCRDVLLSIFAHADRDLCIAPTEIPPEWYASEMPPSGV